MYKIGYAEDIHQLVSDRKLILGGVEINYEKGLLGHSDADVVYHAIGESILGALALGDLGKYFPDNDEKTKNIDSAIIIKHIAKMMNQFGYEISNIDVSIICEKPKLAPYILQMRDNVSSLLKCDITCVSIKAGTNEGLDEIGHGNAIKAVSIVLLKKQKEIKQGN